MPLCGSPTELLLCKISPHSPSLPPEAANQPCPVGLLPLINHQPIMPCFSDSLILDHGSPVNQHRPSVCWYSSSFSEFCEFLSGKRDYLSVIFILLHSCWKGFPFVILRDSASTDVYGSQTSSSQCKQRIPDNVLNMTTLSFA